MELLTAAEMRSIEQAAIESGAVTGLELMERAGQGVVEAIENEWPEYRTAPQSAVVLCGPGNNGGDGYVIARLLQQKGWTISAFCLGNPIDLPPDARINHDRWSGIGLVQPLSVAAFKALPHTLYIDALFGTGLTRPLEGTAAQVISLMAGRGGGGYRDNIICVDAPSGLCMDTGHCLGAPHTGLSYDGINPFARLTVTFHGKKRGHMLGDGPVLCGKVVVKDIGL